LRDIWVVKKSGRREAVRARQARPFDRHRLPQAPDRARAGSKSSIRHPAPARDQRRRRSHRRAQIGETGDGGPQTPRRVAYIRFASVYRDFREAKDFEDFEEVWRIRRASAVKEAGGATLTPTPDTQSPIIVEPCSPATG
jgi:transcriptional repressor NrdR